MSDGQELLSIKDLTVRFPAGARETVAVRNLSFSMRREKIGIVGESGSGKSTVGRAILGLVANPGRVSATHMVFDGVDLTGATDRRIRKLRGRRISMIMQDPRYSLNPTMKIGRQIAEALAKNGLGRTELRDKVLAILTRVRISDPERVFHAYPHEISGGMGQRVMIAMMMLAEPDLLIADEPTSALDVSVRLDILETLDDMVTANGMGLILISHDINMVAAFCDRVLVMYQGRLLEICEARDLRNAAHPYTQGLLSCLPQLGDRRPELPTLIRDPRWLEGPFAQ